MTWLRGNLKLNNPWLDPFLNSNTPLLGLGFKPCQRLRLAHFPGVGRGLQAEGAVWSTALVKHALLYAIFPLHDMGRDQKIIF